MEVRNIVGQMQEARIKQAEARRAQTTPASTPAVAPKATEAYKLDVQPKTTSTKAQGAVDRYGSFYKTSPNGEHLAKLREENESRVKERLERGEE